MGDISGRVVKVRLGGKDISVFKQVENQYSICLSQVKVEGQTVTDAVREIISFLKNRGWGELIIPPTENEDVVIVRVFKNKETHLVETKFYCRYYRAPLSGESRPYTGDDWEVGDFILGTEHSNAISLGWLCTSSGIPGSWREVGPIEEIVADGSGTAVGTDPMG